MNSTLDVVAINELLKDATPQEILKWSMLNLSGLSQTTAFGLTGLAAVDMISKINKQLLKEGKEEISINLIFIDTFYHFKQTLDLIAKIEKRYKLKVEIFTPAELETVQEFEEKFGKELWKSDEDTYDYLVKVSTFFYSTIHPLGEDYRSY